LKKITAMTLACLIVALQVTSVGAQTVSAAPTPESPLIGNILGAVAVIVIFVFIAYAGYKVIKKWSRTAPD
jgi:membrane protein DedA with SNARE-associated domain